MDDAGGGGASGAPDRLDVSARAWAIARAERDSAMALPPLWLDLITDARQAGVLPEVRRSVRESLVFAGAGVQEDASIALLVARGYLHGIRHTDGVAEDDVRIATSAAALAGVVATDEDPVWWELQEQEARLRVLLGDARGGLARLRELLALADAGGGGSRSRSLRFAIAETRTVLGHPDGLPLLRSWAESVVDAEGPGSPEAAQAAIAVAELVSAGDIRTIRHEEWERALAVAEANCGIESPEWLWASTRRAEVKIGSSSNGEAVVSLAALAEVIEADERASERLRMRLLDVRTVAAMNDGAFDDALAMQRAALARAAALYGERSAAAFDTRAAIIDVLAARGELSEARAQAEQLLADAALARDGGEPSWFRAAAGLVRVCGITEEPDVLAAIAERCIDDVLERGGAGHRDGVRAVIAAWAAAAGTRWGVDAVGPILDREVEILAESLREDASAAAAFASSCLLAAGWRLDVGRPEEALDLAERARRALVSAEVDDGPLTIASLLVEADTEVARAMQALGRPGDADALLGALSASLDDGVDDSGPGRMARTRMHTVRSIVLGALGRHAEAVAEAERAAASVLSGTPRGLQARGDLGLALLRAGRDDDALAVMTALDEDLDRCDPVEEDLAAQVRGNLGLLAARRGDDETAVAILTELRRSRAQRLGDADDELDQSARLLALVRDRMGESEAADALRTEVLDRSIRRHGPDAESALDARRERGIARAAAGDRDGALEDLRAVHRARWVEAGPPTPEAIESLRDLAVALVQVGETGEGVPLAEEAGALAAEHLHEADPRRLRVEHDVAWVLEQTGSSDRAARLRRALADAWEAGDERDGEEALEALRSLIRTRIAVGDHELALAELHELLDRERRAGAPASAIGATRSWRVELLLEAGRAADAIVEASENATALALELGPRAPQVLDEEVRITRAIFEAGQAARCRDACLRLLPVLRDSLGPDAPATVETASRLGRALAIGHADPAAVDAAHAEASAIAARIDPLGPLAIYASRQRALSLEFTGRRAEAVTELDRLLAAVADGPHADALELLDVGADRIRLIRDQGGGRASWRETRLLLERARRQLGPVHPFVAMLEAQEREYRPGIGQLVGLLVGLLVGVLLALRAAGAG